MYVYVCIFHVYIYNNYTIERHQQQQQSSGVHNSKGSIDKMDMIFTATHTIKQIVSFVRNKYVHAASSKKEPPQMASNHCIG